MLLKRVSLSLALLTIALGPVNAQQQKIMVAGDSISAGFLRPSYRLPLLTSLSELGCNVEMVGDQTLNDFDFRDPVSTSNGDHYPGFGPQNGYDVTDLSHQAFSAIRADQYADGVNDARGNENPADFYTVKPIADYVADFSPDFMLVHLGTNDMGNEFRTTSQMRSDADINRWANTTLQDVRQVVEDAINNGSPDSKILVANFIPYARFTRTAEELVRAERASDLFTQRLESMVLDLANPRVLIVDVVSEFDPATMTVDGIHPNAVGEQHLAGAFLPVLRGAGLCPDITPAIESPSVGSTVNGDSVQLVWDSHGTDVSGWRVRVWDDQSGSSSTYFDSGNLPAGTTSATVSGLPADLSNVFVSLQFTLNGVPDTVTSNFISRSGTATGAGAPEMSAPQAGAVLSGSAVNFSWKSNDNDITQWWIRIGKTPPATPGDDGSTDYFDSGRIGDESTRAVSVSGLPTDGSTVYVQLAGKMRQGGEWIHNTVTYTAFGAGFPNKVLEPGEWYQVGLPYDPGSENRVRQVFSALPADELAVSDQNLDADGNPAFWVLYEYVLDDAAQQGDNYRLMGADDRVEVGKAYWILHAKNAPVTLSVPSGAADNSSNVSSAQEAACTTPGRCYTLPVDVSLDNGRVVRFSMLSYPFSSPTSPAAIRVSTNNDTVCSTGSICDMAEASQNGLMFETMYVWRPELLDYEYIGPSAGTLRPWDGFWAGSLPDAEGADAQLILSVPATGS